MTQERLRELLHERVADETAPDLSAGAWRAGRRLRRRRASCVVACVAVATVAVSGGVALLDGGAPEPRPVGPSTPVPERPDATYQGVPVWWSPDQQQEQELPAIGRPSPLPPEIVLADATPYAAGELDRAVAAFQRRRTVVLVGPEGELRAVDVSRVEEVTKPNGYSYFPVPRLLRDGSAVVWDQPGGAAVLLDVATGEWRAGPRIEDPTAHAPFATGDAMQYGPVVDGAASWGMGLQLPVSDPGSHLSGPEFMVAGGRVLAFMSRFRDGEDSRFKDCCAVAGWLDRSTVVYESRQVRPVLVAWRVGTGDFTLLSRVRGYYDAGTYAF